MADPATTLFDFERELTCSICTEILFQPLTLLDCLHTYCGGCLQEWFSFQAASVASNRSARRNVNPYTCPSCRETVRGTKADWRLTAHLEGFLKAHPEKGKSEEDKEESRKHYKPGDEVLPPIPRSRVEEEEDSEDERLLAEVRELSMAGVDPETARRRAERAARERQRRRGNGGGRTSSAERERDLAGRQVEHQPSLRSLLSGEDIQEEILQSIYSEGLLEGIDLDNLTTAQEEELTERIAEAYRRRQRNRDRSRNRERRTEASRSPQPTRGESPSRRLRPRAETAANLTPPPSQSVQSRSRPPISRPHVFSQASADATRTTPPARHHRRSGSASGVQGSTGRDHRASTLTATGGNAAAARSATDLSSRPPVHDERVSAARPRTASSSNHAPRSTTNPEGMRESARHARLASTTLQAEVAAQNNLSAANLSATSPSTRPRSRERQARSPARRATTDVSSPEVRVTESRQSRSVTQPPVLPSTSDSSAGTVRPMISHSAFAPEPVIVPSDKPAPLHSSAAEVTSTPPIVTCSACNKTGIETQLHYHCSACSSTTNSLSTAHQQQPGSYNLCQACYRGGKGCRHWFGFGFLAQERWKQSRAQLGASGDHLEYPHVLMARKYALASSPVTQPRQAGDPTAAGSGYILQTGAFCETCTSHADECYWYCEVCLSGAWGFCHPCVLKGLCCTHGLLAVQRSVDGPALLSYGVGLNDTTAGAKAAKQQTQHHTQAQGKNIARDGGGDTAAGVITLTLPIPHLPANSYTPSQVPLHVDCDICGKAIAPASPRFHCIECSEGDYDVCTECYRGLCVKGETALRTSSSSTSTGNMGVDSVYVLSPMDGEFGWRKCPREPERHRLVVVIHDAAGRRVVVRERVGGWRFKADAAGSSSAAATGSSSAAAAAGSLAGKGSAAGSFSGNDGMSAGNGTGANAAEPPAWPAPDTTALGARYLATWSYFPDVEANPDELAFPRNAEIREGEDLNEDWSVGVYAGRVGVFPRNHTRRIA